jgi:glycosyltransferase involved in cell wall biosynthesis
MTVPSVTAVVPTRDRPELLRSAIAAILDQEYPGDIEVVVVYDQSAPDRNLERADRHRRVRIISNDRTPGLAGARNAGILAATGDLIAFCDDDDEWLPGKLTAQVEALTAAGPDAEFAATGIRVSYDGAFVDRVLSTARVPLTALLRSRLTELHPSTFLIRRSALVLGIGLIEEKIPGSYAEDYEFLLRAARRAPLVNLSGAHVLVRWHKRSYFSQRWQTIADALQWLLDRYPEFSTEPRGVARVSGQIAFAHAALGRRRHAVRWVGRTLRRNPREPRAYLALAVASRAVRPDTVMRRLHALGRGL